jgi:hypothetical protein
LCKSGYKVVAAEKGKAGAVKEGKIELIKVKNIK